MLDLLKSLGDFMRVISFIIPPRMHQNGNTDLVERTQRYSLRVQRWQWAVFVSIVLLTISFTANAVFSWGYEPYVKGFVRKTDYQMEGTSLKAEMSQNLSLVKRIEVRLLIQDLITTRIGQCRSSSKGYFTIRLDELMREFRDMTGSEWHVPECSEVIDQ